MLVLKLLPAVLLVVATSSIQGAPHGGPPPARPPADDAPPPWVMDLFMEAMAQGMSMEEATAYVQQKMMEEIAKDPSLLGPPPPSKQKKSDEAPPPWVMDLFMEAMAQGMSMEEATAYVQQKMMEEIAKDPSLLGPPPPSKQKKSDEAPPPWVMDLFMEAMAQGMSMEEATAYVQQKMMEEIAKDPSLLGPPPPSKQKKSDEAPPPWVMDLFMEAMAQGMSMEEATAYVQQKMMEEIAKDPSLLGPPQPSKQKKSA
ncbi:Hypp1915 [Branchiostoma lanceolatum]|uniref:Hypp1915 protein n=1 Tax=Branchiostoma lanceolatum TaxID=7740 RepID=A0A8K0EMZ0_BRALA|nr:Hypp1915 [Branchiostoma lanceolatum]